MRGKPAPPKRASYTRTIILDSGDTIEEILAKLENVGINPSEATFQEGNCDDYGGCHECGSYAGHPGVTYKEPESDKHWEASLATYRKRLASWEEWYEEHKEEIAARVAEEAEEKDARLTRLAEKSVNSLKKERKTLEKRLENLKKRLQK